MKITNIISWVLRIGSAFILLQTLYFKFSGQPESVELFTKLGAEPWGRFGSGIVELIASILLIIPRTAFWGAFLGAGVMSGALLSHIMVIGIESNGDGGFLFILALIVLVSCLILTVLHKKQGLDVIAKLRKK
jgi:putative oxidoreductase